MRCSAFSFGVVLGVQLAVPPVSVPADLETIRERGHLVVAVRDEWRPLSYRDESDNLVGLEIDLARRLAEVIFEDPGAVVFEVVPNRERLQAVLEEQVDVAIAGVTITPDRMRLVRFSPPYYLDGTGLLVENPELKALEDIRLARIGLLQGSSAIPSVRYLLPLAELTPLSSYQEALITLDAGRIDAFAGDISVLVGWQQEYEGYRLIPQALSADPLAIVMPKGNQYNELHDLVNEVLESWHDSGWLEERATYWGLP
jgi:polar amino acid transport system substrate-binding protein